MILNIPSRLRYGIGLITVLCTLGSCRSSEEAKTIDRETLIKDAPVLTPEQFIRHTHIEDGFEIQLVASEPQISTPVSMVFDKDNRIWAVEMRGYMPNAEGSGEDTPNGQVVVLEDQDQDGVYESRKVVIDSLVMPRSLALVDGGILVVEPPNLWYFTLEDDKPTSKVLIDPEYTEGGNVEAQANGLFRAIDNWIYNGGSDKRYRKFGNEWVTEKTHLRGQWGITQDDMGRLFYNNNSQNLLGDYFLPGMGSNNPNLNRTAGYNQRIVKDNRTYPSRPTPGVNRGYMNNVLDDSLRLLSFTAACGPVIYRGSAFDGAYQNNAFVAEPAANLIKRNVLNFQGNQVSGKQAYKGKEFLASDDERFRPVNLYNGPEGALYVVDMYRGIIQHKAFLTEYLKDEILARDLENPLDCGRIYKIVPEGFDAVFEGMPEDSEELVDCFSSENSWVREQAQAMLVDRQDKSVIPQLQALVADPESQQQFVHALWTLEGLGALQAQLVLSLLESDETQRQIQGFAVMDKVIDKSNYLKFVPAMQAGVKDSLLAPYVGYQLHLIEAQDSRVAEDLRFKLLERYPDNAVIADAVLSNLYEQEAVFYQTLQEHDLDTSAVIWKKTQGILTAIENRKNNPDQRALQRKYHRGISFFKQTCMPCHGEDGAGIQSLAPPLSGSEWVTGNKERLIGIVLYGLTGPIEVDGKLYQAPEISGEMPGIVNNPDLVAGDLALTLSYIRNNWNNQASEVSREEVLKVMKMLEGRDKPFTQQELEAWEADHK